MSKAYRGFWRLNRRKNSKARKPRVQSPLQLGHEALEGKRLLAVTSAFDPVSGELLFTDDATGQTANTVSLYMGDATGSTVSYSINGGALTPQAGVTSIRFQDDAADAGDTLELFGFGSSAIAVSGTSMTFGGVLPITTASVENFLVEAGGPRAPVTLDDQSVAGNVTVRNALTTTIGATRAFELGGSLSIESLSVSLPGQIIAGGDVDIDSHDTSTLAGQITSRSGSVTIESLIGNLDLSANAFLITTLDPAAGDVTLRSHCGTVVVEQVCATGDVLIEGELGVTVEQIVDGSTVTILAECGFANIAQLCVEGDISIQAGLDITLGNVITSDTGDIEVESTSGGVRFAGAATLHAIVGSIDVTAVTTISGLGGSVTAVTVQSGGAFYEYASVTIAPPASGSGRAARASAVISPIVISPTGAITGGVITAINIDDPGYGYAPDEQIEVVIEGSPERTSTIIPGNSVLAPTPIEITIPAGDGAQAFAVAAVTGAIIAGQGVTISAGFDIALDLPIDGSDVTLTSACGQITVGRVCADVDVSLNGAQGVTVGTELRSEVGAVMITAAAGAIAVLDIYSGREITVNAAENVTITGLAVAQKDVSVSSDRDISLEKTIVSKEGAISVASTAGAISLSANIAAAEAVVFKAGASIVQSLESGVTELTVLSGGSGYTAGAVVKIAEPAGGGTAATASAVVENGVVTKLILTSPGSGYAVGESPAIVITGNLVGGGGQNAAPPAAAGSGASAVAVGPAALPSISGKSVSFAGDAGVTLSSTVKASDGDVTVTSESGSLALDAGSVLIQAEKGGISLNSGTGFVAARNLISRDDVAVEAFGRISLAGDVTSALGDVKATSAAASVDLTANLRAEAGVVEVTAKSSINQAAESGVSKIELINGGTGYTLGATVNVAAPLSGGVAAKAVAIIESGIVTRLVVTDPGSGYAVGENPSVTIVGGSSAGAVSGTGAAARAFGPLAQQQVLAGKGIAFDAGTGVALQSTVVAYEGDITISTAVGNLALDAGAALIESRDGDISLSSGTGVVSAQRLLAAKSVLVNAYLDANVSGEAKAGSDITITSMASKAAVTNLVAGDGIEVRGATGVRLEGEIIAGGNAGDGLVVESSAAGIEFAANIAATNGIDFKAAAAVNQLNTTGITGITLQNGGSGYTAGAKVEIAPPSAGGSAAKAELIIEGGVVTKVILTSAGSGYAVGETPSVTITGNLSGGGPNAPAAPTGSGASAVATGPLSVPRVVAGGAITLRGRTGVSLNSLWESKTSEIVVRSDSGNLSLENGSLKLKAFTDVSLSAEVGGIAAGNLYAGDEIKVDSVGNVVLNGELVADGARVDVASRNGAVSLASNINAANGAIELRAASSMTQASTGGLVRLELVAGGSGYTDRVVVTIAAPQGGGVAAQASAVITNGAITSLILTNPGSGYAVGERPAVSFSAGPEDGVNAGGRGASANAIGPESLPRIAAQDNITIVAGAGITLTTLVRSTEGDVTVRSKTGDLSLAAGSFLVVTESGTSSVSLTADTGAIDVQRVDAAGTVTIDAGQDATVVRVSAGGDASISAETSVNVRELLESRSGEASVTSTVGSVTVNDVVGGEGITIESGDAFLLERVLRADQGNITITSNRALDLGTPETDASVIAHQGDIVVASKASAVGIDARLVATKGKIAIDAQGAVTQAFGTGITRFEIVNGGLAGEQPTVALTIAPPVGGGQAATANAVIGSRQVGFDPITGAPVLRFFIDSIVVTNVGQGYAVGENPLVTVTGIENAVVRAFGPTALRTLTAGNGVTITGGEDITLANAVTAIDGDIAIRSLSGSLDLSANTVFIHAESGKVDLEAECGEVKVERVCAQDEITVVAPQGVTIEDELRSTKSSVTVTADAGPIAMNDVYAATGVDVTAAQDVGVTGLIQATRDIAITSTSGGLSVTGQGKIHSLEGELDLVSKRGSAILQDLFAHKTLTVVSLGDVALNGAIQSTTANVDVSSDGNINNGARILAGGSINLAADLSVTSLGGGIIRLELLSGGVNYEYAIVTVAAPADGGGRAALARATISGGSITGLTIVDPGYGYAPNERVQVTIEGNPEQRDRFGNIVRPAASGATAAAFSGSALSSLSAGDGVSITAGTAIDITNEVRAKTGAVDLNVTAGTLDVSDIFAGKNVGLTAAQTIQIAGLVRSDAGDVAVNSNGGGIDLRGTILAPRGGAEVTAAGQIVQRGGSVSRDRIYLLSGGRQYTYALVVVDPPPGAGETALARAVITYYDPLDLEAGGYISDIILLDGGWGYPSDSRVNVRIQGDGEGAAAVFATDLVTSSIDVRDDVNMLSGDSITLVSAVRSSAGDVSIRNTLGDISVQSVTAGDDAEVVSERGDVTLVSVATGGDATISAFRGVTVTDSVNAVAGDISISTLNGDLTFVQAFDFGDNYLVDDAATVLLPRAVIASKGGGVSLASANGSIVTPYVVNAAKNVSITSFGALELANDITSTGGDIVAKSTSGLVRLRSNIAADAGSISVEAQTQLQQETVSGISKIELLSPGPMLDVPPDVTVTIAAPREGGVPARAIAVIERRALNDNRDNDNNANNEDIIAYEYFIGSIAIIDAGRGYAVGEQPVVTITGVAGASARAFGPNVVAMLTAQDDISLSAGENLTLLTKIHSVGGDINVFSKTGDLDLSAGSLLLSAKGGSVNLDADHGSAKIQRLAGAAGVTVDALYGLQVLGSVHSSSGGISLATKNGAANVRHLNARDDVRVTSFQTATLGGEIASQVGDVVAQSTAGGIFLQANVVAGGDVSLDAQTFVEQNHGTGLERVDVVARGSVIATGATATIPAVTVTIAAPVGGGETATAQAIIGQRSLGRNAQSDTETIEFFIESIFITNPGSGYALGETPVVTITGMPGAVAQGIGPTNLRNVTAGNGISITAVDNIKLLNAFTALAGDVVMTSKAGNVDFTRPSALIYAAAGDVSLTSTSRSVLNTPTLNVGGDINITSFNNLDLKNELTSSGGDITVRSTSGGINLAGNLHSHNDSVTLVAKAGIVQAGRGIMTVTMVSGGSGYGAGTLVTIAPPSAGGTAARGRAIIGTVNGVAGVITGVQIITPGAGYAVGEEVNVTFTGAGAGASGFAVAGTTPQNILAGEDVTLLAGTGVKILNAVNSTNGDIEIRTINGNLDFNSTEAVLSAENGGVTLSSFNGSILSPPVLHVAGDIVMEAFTAIPVANQLTSDAGSIRVASSSGSVSLNANVFAAERVELVAKTGISQPNGFIQADSLVVRNGSNTAVSLGNAFNNVNQLAATTLGSFSYTDANDFETGVNRGGPVGVEIRADALNLTALAPLSTVRVVSGLQYRSLSISAGAAFGANVGTVEYVVTSGGDSAAANAAFQGSLRDMTRYLNDNTATYVLNGSRVPQKSAIVFDEDGYLVEEIVVAGALPAMTKPVAFDGGRLEQTATVDRIGLRGTATTPTGLTFGLGSSGSTLTKTAAYGFTNGSAIVMASGNNTVTDVHVGIDAAGLVRANRLGLDINGTAAVNNLIGSTTFDVDRANRFAGNSLAGVLIRGGASGNRVFGNIIGDETGLAPDRGNGDGIRISSATGNVIGTPEEVRPDLVASVSNVIMGNRGRGIQVLNANSGTFATANRIRNNYIANNAVGIGIQTSKFAIIGGTAEDAGNTIVSQTGTGVEVSGSSNVRIVANYIGLRPAGDVSPEALAGNRGDGVFVGNGSQAVEIMAGNRIGANQGHGVSIASGATGVVLTGNTIGGTLSDGTPAGNAFDGVAISTAIGNTVGAGNVVARNGRHGVSIADTRAASLTAGNRVIGSEITANASSGVFLNGGSFSTIGGPAAAANRINANGGSGVRMEVSSATGAATGNLIEGNLIGADVNRSVNPATGNVGSGISIVGGVGNVIANGNVIMNNAVNGVELLGGSGNTVGGNAAGQGNTISHNATHGVRVAAATGVAATATTPTGHVITGNTIASNARNGVMVGSGSGITVGQTVTATQSNGAGNTIFGNLNHGVSIGAAAQQVAVQGNAVFGNALGAISRANGANRSASQTLSLTTATVQQTGTVSQPITISGHLSNPSYGQQQYSVDIYASNPEDGNYGTLTGYQARRFLGRATVTTDAAGKATFTIRITTPIRVGEVITANSTALRFEAGSSSAESNAVVVALQNIPVPGTPTPPPAPTPTPRPTPGRPTPRPAPRGR